MTPEEALPPRHEQRRLQLRSEPAARRAGAPGDAPVERLPARSGATQEGALSTRRWRRGGGGGGGGAGGGPGRAAGGGSGGKERSDAVGASHHGAMATW